MRKILPKILAFITGRERYLPRDIEWVKGNWTHNIFRAWEVVFWRAFGPNGIGDTIRAESSVEGWMDKEGNLHVHRNFYTLEAVVAHAEGMVRKAWKEAWEPKPQCGFMPQPVFITMMVLGLKLSFQGDLNGMLSPLIGGAIAYDASNKNIGTTTSLSFSLTTSGSNRLMILGGQLQDNTRSWSSITYAGNATTQIGSNIIYLGNNAPGQMRYQIAPTTGANNAVFTPSASIYVRGMAVNYTGCAQSGQPDGTAQGSGSSSQNVTVTAANCWMVAQCVGFNNDFDTAGPSLVTLAGTLTTFRQYYDDGMAIVDSNGTIGTGSQSYQFSNLNSNNGRIAASIAPLTTTQYDQTVTATVDASASYVRKTSKIQTATVDASVTYTKRITQTIAALFEALATDTNRRVYIEIVLAAIGATVNIAMKMVYGVQETASAAASVAVTTHKTLLRTITAAVDATATTIKKVSQTLVATAEASATEATVKVKHVIETASVIAAATTSKALTLNRSLTASAKAVIRLVFPFYTTKYPKRNDDYSKKY